MQKTSFSTPFKNAAALCVIGALGAMAIIHQRHTTEQAHTLSLKSEVIGPQIQDVPIYAGASEKARESLAVWQDNFEEQALFCGDESMAHQANDEAKDQAKDEAQDEAAQAQGNTLKRRSPSVAYAVTHKVVSNSEQLYTVVSHVNYVCSNGQKGQSELTLNLSKLTGEAVNMAALLEALPNPRPLQKTAARTVGKNTEGTSPAIPVSDLSMLDADTAGQLEPLPYGIRTALATQLKRNEIAQEQSCKSELMERLAQKSLTYSDFNLTLTNEGMALDYHQEVGPSEQRICRLGLMLSYEKLRAYSDLKYVEEAGLKNLFFAPTNSQLGTGITVFPSTSVRLN